MTLSTIPRWKSVGTVVAILLLAAVLQFFDANPAASQALYLTAYEAPQDPGLDPSAGVWKDVPPIRVPLTAQSGIYSAGGGSVPFVNAQALHYNNQVYIRVQWDDATLDESTLRAQDFADAVALEFPAKAASSVPSICMGQADAGVNIWHWRADSQAGGPAPDVVHEGMLDDGSPEVFYTARMVGNPFANPDAGAVQTLISQTFGALSPAARQDVVGQGERLENGWAVVFMRANAGADTD
ncbi:MAG: ethylbenzene dehydrogenase-related protein, partial [Dehalococcoidia bacterium]|nr:ethylbenzene dehydrogenase-related protein [Dehalococcoidia bacterium]